MNDAAYSILDAQAMSDAKLWHAWFGHLNFSSLLRLHKYDMVLSLPSLKALEKHVCEGCILGKMQRIISKRWFNESCEQVTASAQ